MKVKNFLIPTGIILLIAILVWLNNTDKFENGRQSFLNKFADNKEVLATLLEGHVAYQGDTVEFDLIARLPFEIEEDEHDVLTVKTKGKVFSFERKMVNQWHIPAPIEGEGKKMGAWSGLGTSSEFYQVLKNVLEHGVPEYAYLPKDLGERKEQFIKMYKLDEKDAAELSVLVIRPFFSSRKAEKILERKK